MDETKKPSRPESLKSEGDCNDQKSIGLSGGVLQISDYFTKTESNQENFQANGDLIGATVNRLQAEYEADGGPRVIKPNYVSVTGWIAGTDDHDPVPFESSLERDCAFLAMFEPRITLVAAQPYTILYRDSSGRSRRYTPDFELSYLDV